VRRLISVIVGVALAWVVDVIGWLHGCDEVPDCRGIPLAAYYAAYALTAAVFALTVTAAIVVVVLGLVRRRRR
jgi:hypothetical protein